MKDPAFLFYSKDFYEATRTMLPDERACFIDLMIYQHQNGFIPNINDDNNIKRLLMYCSGIDKATLIATLQAKFKQCEKGWYNNRLNTVINDRKEYSEKQSVNGQVGQFYKKAKLNCNAKDYKKIRDYFVDLTNDQRLIIIEKLDKEHKSNIEAMLKALLKHLVNVNVNVNEDENTEKGVKGEKQIILPFDSENFRTFWENWKTYKNAEHNFKYKTEQSEQAALLSIAKLSGGDEKTATEIIMQSMENGWKGFFEIKKNNTNGNSKLNNNRPTVEERLRRADRLVDELFEQQKGD